MNSLRILGVLLGGGAMGGYRRIIYLVATVAVAAAAWLALSAMTTPFSGTMQTESSSVTIKNGARPMAGLPLRYTRRIEAIPGALDVTWMTFQMVKCQSSPVVGVVLVGFGGPGAVSRLSGSGQKVDPGTLGRWRDDPMGFMVTSKAAADCGWHAGQSVEPPELMGQQDVEVHVIGIIKNPRDGAFGHFDYINRIGSFVGQGKVMSIGARARTAAGNELLAARIEAAFAHDFPTVSATTNATEQNALARFGKVQQILMFVAGAILLCTASVLISIFAHTAAQRRTQFALLQVLGFQRGTLLASVVLEGLLIITVGAVLGTGLGLLVTHIVGDATALGRLIAAGGLVPPAWAFAWMPAWLAGLLCAALVAPAWLIRRVRAADYRAI